MKERRLAEAKAKNDLVAMDRALCRLGRGLTPSPDLWRYWIVLDRLTELDRPHYLCAPTWAFFDVADAMLAELLRGVDYVTVMMPVALLYRRNLERAQNLDVLEVAPEWVPLNPPCCMPPKQDFAVSGTEGMILGALLASWIHPAAPRMPDIEPLTRERKQLLGSTAVVTATNYFRLLRFLDSIKHLRGFTFR